MILEWLRGLWRDFLGRDSRGIKKKKEEEEKDEEGVDTHLAGQVLIHKALKHEVCSPSSPPVGKEEVVFERKILARTLIIPLLPPSSASLSSSTPPIKPIFLY